MNDQLTVRTILVALLRESSVLLAGSLAASAGAFLARGAMNGFGSTIAVLVSIVVCLGRTIGVRYPFKPASQIRILAFETLSALAIILLFVFELGIAFIAGLKQFPALWVGAVFFAGIGYVLLMTTAQFTGGQLTSDLSDDSRERVHPDDSIGVPLLMILIGTCFFIVHALIIFYWGVGPLNGWFVFGYLFFYGLTGLLTAVGFACNLWVQRPQRSMVGIYAIAISFVVTVMVVIMREALG